jgi:A/G-specific adenine glycosylase
MLQQTQVSTVLAYYPRFLARMPDVATLAAAPQEEVLALWSGLGYYSRARNLHRCAQVVVAEHGGRFPASAQALSELPGIGRSTAAAIAAFCFKERAAILDGNVKRVLARTLGFGDDLASATNERRLWQRACELLPARGEDMPAYTQGLMDLGATLCLPRRPDCPRCPLSDLCTAHREGRPEAYPVKTRKLKRSRRESWWLWLEHRGAVWLQQRPAQGIWAGLWSLPLLDDEDAVAAAVQALGLPAEAVELQPAIDHALTHLDWRLHPRRVRLDDGADPAVAVDAVRASGALGNPAEGRWVRLDALDALGLPAPLRRLLGS